MRHANAAAVLVPVKAFADAKVRLAPALPAPERAALARSMAESVIRAARPLPVAVVCDHTDVVSWAASLGAMAIETPGLGLNGAVAAGVDRLATAGFDHVIVAHADLPLALDVTWPARFPGITLVPDRRDDGTNVLAVPARCGFRFAYGPGSFRRHLSEVARLGFASHVVRRTDLAWDVDVPADLTALTPA